MPAPVRRIPTAPATLAPLTLVLATAAAAAGNAGFGPPPGHSPNAHRTNTAYWVVFGFTAAIFVLVETTLVVFAIKYRRRNRPRTAEGAEVHGHTRIEVIWT